MSDLTAFSLCLRLYSAAVPCGLSCFDAFTESQHVQYDASFKKLAICMAEEQGHSAAAWRLNVNETTIRECPIRMGGRSEGLCGPRHGLVRPPEWNGCVVFFKEELNLRQARQHRRWLDSWVITFGDSSAFQRLGLSRHRTSLSIQPIALLVQCQEHYRERVWCRVMQNFVKMKLFRKWSFENTTQGNLCLLLRRHNDKWRGLISKLQFLDW